MRRVTAQREDAGRERSDVRYKLRSIYSVHPHKREAADGTVARGQTTTQGLESRQVHLAKAGLELVWWGWTEEIDIPSDVSHAVDMMTREEPRGTDHGCAIGIHAGGRSSLAIQPVATSLTRTIRQRVAAN